MRKTLILGVLVGLLSAASAFAAEPVKIGYLAALTGNDAAYGVAEVQSAQMYVTKRTSPLRCTLRSATTKAASSGVR